MINAFSNQDHVKQFNCELIVAAADKKEKAIFKAKFSYPKDKSFLKLIEYITYDSNFLKLRGFALLPYPKAKDNILNNDIYNISWSKKNIILPFNGFVMTNNTQKKDGKVISSFENRDLNNWSYITIDQVFLLTETALVIDSKIKDHFKNQIFAHNRLASNYVDLSNFSNYEKTQATANCRLY